MPKKVTLAKFAGFCHGVRRAVETVKKLKEQNPNKRICVLGELIHNTQVIDELKTLGIETLSEIPSHGSGICVIRSHGESPKTFEKIKQAGFEVYDLTCPDVKKVQQKAIELVQEGYFLVIVGKALHPEVIAIRANAQQYSDKVAVAETPKQLEEYEEDIKKSKKVGIVVQTTQTLSTLKDITSYLLPLTKELRVANTICRSTSMRQTEAVELGKQSDLTVVVGSKKSANTTHLAEILKDITKTIHIETSDELDSYRDLIEKSEKISVTAGASTPQNVIDNVLEKIKGE